jgi:CHAT domain-containing protein
MRSAAALLLFALFATIPAHADLGAEFRQTETPQDCDALVHRHGGGVLAYGCYLDLARRQRSHPDIARHLEAFLALNPNDHAARLTLGRIEADQNSDGALDHYARALAGFEEDANHEGAFYTRLMFAFFYQYRTRYDEAETELQAAEEAARLAARNDLLGRAKSRRGWLAYNRNDYGTAWIRFKEAEQAVFPEGPRRVQVEVLDSLGTISKALGRYRQALEYYERQADLLGEDGLLVWEAAARTNVAEISTLVRKPRRFTDEERRAFCEQAIEVSIRAGSPGSGAISRILLGQQLEGAEAIVEYEGALELARTIGDWRIAQRAQRELALARSGQDASDSGSAVQIVENAMTEARSKGSVEEIALDAAVLSDLRWRLGARDEAVAQGLAALDAIEQVRDLQHDEMVRARTFGRFAPAYYRLAGHLLNPSGHPPSDEDVALAFGVIERMRSRVLLDALDAADITGTLAGSGASCTERRRILDEIAQVQKQLLDGELSANERAHALGRLERLEVEEVAMREAIAAEDPSFGAVRRPEIPSLAEVQSLLRSDQAMLAYQIESGESEELERWGGGSWQFVITRDDARALRLQNGDVLVAEVEIFLGLLSRRDGTEARAAAHLYEKLLGSALSGLSPEVSSLVVVPDGPLFRLPFAALREDESADPVAGRYAIDLVPSATLWHRWKRAEDPDRLDAALVFADPTLESTGDGLPSNGNGIFRERPQLGPLPRARGEGRAMVSRVGGESRLFEGEEATEHALKTTPLGDYRVLHFAAHALIDEEQPQRSAVVLAPGAAEEDGLVQPREIAELDLEGQTVILSACSSATGTVLDGEGVMGVARAFFQAGAHAVVGSLWPLRDDEAAELVSDISRLLVRGESIGSAVAQAERDWMRSGRPAASWAGLVILGDGDHVPFPGVASSRRGISWTGFFLFALLLLAASTILVRLFRRRRGSIV